MLSGDAPGRVYRHARRGARSDVVELFALLHDRWRHRRDGLIEMEVTVQTGWDADRLDLGRVGIVPRPERLCIAQARDPVLFERAHRRSVR